VALAEEAFAGGAATVGAGDREPYLARVRRITDGVLALRDRAVTVLRDAVDSAGMPLDAASAAGLPDALVEAVRAAPPVPAAVSVARRGGADGPASAGVIPLPFPVWSIGGDKPDEPARACGGCR
jgi:hypothetical protein